MPELYTFFEQLSADNHIAHIFTKKPLSFDPKPEPNLAALRRLLGYNFHTLKYASQRHTANLKIITDDDLITNAPIPDTDGLITNLPGVALATYTADCQAIFLYDPVRQVIANVHSGWRGTLQKIAPQAVKLMCQNFDCRPENIQAYICPSILKCCFEIDSNVADQFIAEFGRPTIAPFLHPDPASSKFHLDTVGLNSYLLEQLGLPKRHIIASDICTKCHSDIYHSHRATPTSGRNLALICLK